MSKWVTSGYQPGDLIMMDFDGGGPDHIGICETVKPDGSIDTIEGNTALTNDSNGGQVMRRTRYPHQVIGACRPAYGADDVDILLKTARKELNVTENPPNSNNVKYNTEYYGKPVTGSAYPWCVVFVHWCFRHSGLSALFYGGSKTANCTELARYYGMGSTAPAKTVDVPMQMLRKGSVGIQVKLLQYILSIAGYAVGTIDGDFGAKTDAAVRSFQASKKLASDGIVGALTWAALVK